MGTWNVGPFDNDHAADFAGDLDDADADQRVGLIRKALSAVAGPDGQTTSGVADPAIAAAALVAAQQRPARGVPVHSVYGPEETTPPLPGELVALALDVLDRVTAPDSDVKELWAETADHHPWHDEIARLKAALGTGR